MKRKIVAAFAAVSLLTLAGAASAEPLRLDAGQMDAVSAGGVAFGAVLASAVAVGGSAAFAQTTGVVDITAVSVPIGSTVITTDTVIVVGTSVASN